MRGIIFRPIANGRVVSPIRVCSCANISIFARLPTLNQTMNMKLNSLWLSISLMAIAGTASAAGGKWDINKLDASKLPPASSKTGITFANDIQPIMEDSCTRCHGEDRAKGNLHLDSLDAVLKGGKDGKVVVAGSSDKSLLVLAVSQMDDATAMPPKFKPRNGGPGGPPPGGAGGPPPGAPPGGPDGPGGPPPGGPGGGPGGPHGGFGAPPKPLTPEQVGLVRAWIDQGAN